MEIEIMENKKEHEVVSLSNEQLSQEQVLPIVSDTEECLSEQSKESVPSEVMEDSHITENVQSNSLSLADSDCLQQIDNKLNNIDKNEQRLFAELREMHKSYHSYFASTLSAMQNELEHYRAMDKGRAYDDILTKIAKIYSTYETLADEVAESNAKKGVEYLLEDIEDLLNAYGVLKLSSSVGDKRNLKHSRVLNRIVTDNPEKHDTVAKSHSSGFYMDKRTLVEESVDIFIHHAPSAINESEQPTINNCDTPVAE